MKISEEILNQYCFKEIDKIIGKQLKKQITTIKK